ncbi:DUF881 domain-containing protein [Thalassiella azotivora]
MTLLKEVMERPLDPGYAAAARRRAEGPPDGGRRRLPVTAVLAAVAGVLLVAAVVELRVPASQGSRAVLTDEIEQRTADVDRLEDEVVALQAEIDGIGERALAGSEDATVEQAQLYARVTGAAPVTGPGVRVVLADASSGAVDGSDPRQVEQSDQGRVRDRDLQVVVNGLWEAGAEAIAVNGQRLTATSSIREAGAAVLVNFRPLSPPYDIQAIGDPQGLQVRFASSLAGRYLAGIQQNYGVRASVTGAAELQLPGATGVRLRYAVPAPSGQTVDDGAVPATDLPTSQTPSETIPSETDAPEESP